MTVLPVRALTLTLPALLAMVLLSFTSAAQNDRVGYPLLPPATGEACVEPADVMRADHMMFLRHQRDATMRGGVRDARHSLVGCVSCHVQKDDQGVNIPVDAAGQFCESCHTFVGASMDCFECHATVPAAGKMHTALPAPIPTAKVSFAHCQAEDNS